MSEMPDKICRMCGNISDFGINFEDWAKPTFTDHDKLLSGNIICHDCLFWFNESSQELADKLSKEKPQKMRNYSHFLVNGEWIPLSKGDKSQMIELLLHYPFPELAAIATSGQKHIVFKARKNIPKSIAGWVQFEEQAVWVEPKQLSQLLNIIQSLMIEFSKTEIKTTQYKPYRIINFGLQQWRILEQELKKLRGSSLFELALFLAQKEDNKNGEKSSRLVGDNLVGDRERIQKSVSSNDMGSIREYSTGKRIHKQSGKIRQFSLFEA